MLFHLARVRGKGDNVDDIGEAEGAKSVLMFNFLHPLHSIYTAALALNLYPPISLLMCSKKILVAKNNCLWTSYTSPSRGREGDEATAL